LSDTTKGSRRQRGRAATATLPRMKTSYRDRLTELPLPDIKLAAPTSRPNARAEVVSYSDDRRTRGLKSLNEIAGDPGVAVVQGLRDLAPDLADWIIDFSYGDVMTRPGLDRRSRQLATIAALTALGNAQPQLKVHIQGALNVGCEPREIIEVILQMTVFCGFPAAINALGVAREVLRK
jgi:4-carboxymuconolactone decarboxylase